MSSPVAAPDVLYDASKLLDVHLTRSLLQSTPQAYVCPETEYYCGPGDAFEKEVHDALNQPKGCNYDNGKLAPSSARHLASQATASRAIWWHVLGRGVQLSFTPWSECGADCGAGYNDRSAICADADGIPVDVSACSAYSGPQLSGSCQGTSCAQAHYLTGAWTACNATCDGGLITRAVTCVDAKLRPTAASACKALAAPMTQRPCNTAPCVGHSWQVGQWGSCSKPCGGGIRRRSVQCMNQFGQVADNGTCLGVQPADELQCNVMTCNFCSLTNCAGQGVCKSGVCVCQPGYRGSYCEISPACSGILDQAGNCCATGVVSQNGTCCGQGALLDRHSTCCISGKLDACGACGGPARAVDVQNVCCNSGVLDGDGYCCQSGLLDECGVCDGQSTACALRAVVDVQVSQAASYLSLGTYAFAYTMEGFMSSTLSLNASNIAITDLVVEPGSLISQASQTVKLRVDLTATPSGASSATMDLSAAQATRKLQDAAGQTSGNQLLVLLDAPLVQRTPICGNQVCEPGERTIAGPNNLGCPGDCAFPLVACPAPAGGVPCSNRGWCASAFGACQCWFGYAGDDCSQCAEGYIRSGDLCTRYVKADLPLLDLSSKAGLDSVLGIGIALIALALLLMCIMAIILIRMRKKTNKKRGKKGKGLASRESSVQNVRVDATAMSLGASALNMVSHGASAPEKRPGKGAASSEEFASVARSAASVRQVNAGVRPAIPALKPDAAAVPAQAPRQQRANFRIEDTAAQPLRSGTTSTLESAIQPSGILKQKVSPFADRQPLAHPEGSSSAALLEGQQRDTGMTVQQPVLSPAGSGQAPASWPLLGEAQAKRSQALELVQSKSGRML
ncbi:g6916 [Coccomyxa viridis]|uniref:G6916 protein n=1 Tax=Coccomyxa viridis TaxID=1274662 RepID=A0ABP1FWI3_9CHLO